MITAQARCNALRANMYGHGLVDLEWKPEEPTSVRVRFVSSDMGLTWAARITREDLGLAVDGTTIKTMTYGMVLSGTELWIGWRLPDRTPCCVHVDTELILFVLDGSEGELPSGSDEEAALISAATEELIAQMDGWTD